ncbi:MAG: hypothetical protein IJ426_00320 [Clostridia bacterium]|nr:hypothetical protein [Clostridia bacterium]
MFDKIFKLFPKKTSKLQGEEDIVQQEKTSVADEIECCILCGKSTGVCVYTPVEQRAFYITGCGQLCAECYNNLHEKNRSGDALADERVLFAVKQSRDED